MDIKKIIWGILFTLMGLLLVFYAAHTAGTQVVASFLAGALIMKGATDLLNQLLD